MPAKCPKAKIAKQARERHTKLAESCVVQNIYKRRLLAWVLLYYFIRYRVYYITPNTIQPRAVIVIFSSARSSIIAASRRRHKQRVFLILTRLLPTIYHHQGR
jgi:hypothetical protein